ncbi:S-adenosyl-L-methionine-dependent methyltransferase [Xylaria telfairii]|nr:S-adenosyl-L-methionine-dependent methyltransferase [Xylaria telfairii]
MSIPNEKLRLSLEELGACLLDKSTPEHTLAALQHRRNLVKAWGILSGSKVLEIGPGQGDFTVILADAVGPTGQVVAVDPAPLDWGTPDLASAQAHTLASPLGSRINFVQAEPAVFLENNEETFDSVVFGYCIWFFADPSVLPIMLSWARNRAHRLLIAEYSLSASTFSGIPHVLAAMTSNVIEAVRTERSDRNIRCVLTPIQIAKAAKKAGWSLHKQQTLIPELKQIEGMREVRMLIKSQNVRKELETLMESLDTQKRTMLLGMLSAVDMSVQKVEGGISGLRNMDSWVAQFHA